MTSMLYWHSENLDDLPEMFSTENNMFSSSIYRNYTDQNDKPFIVASLILFNTHMCNNHAVQSASWYATPVRWMDYLSKGEVLTNTDLDRFVNKIWEK